MVTTDDRAIHRRDRPGRAGERSRVRSPRIHLALPLIQGTRMRIESIKGREILDSRGNPTVEVDVVAARVARSAAPRCRRAPRRANAKRWSCATATRNAISAKAWRRRSPTSTARSPQALRGRDADQRAVDRPMIELDGTPNKGRLGANAMLGVSMALARATAAARHVPLYALPRAALRRQRPRRGCPCR